MWSVCRGRQFGKNGQKLHEDFWRKQWGREETNEFSSSGGRFPCPPSPPPLEETLGIKDTMSLRVLYHYAILLKMPVIKGAILFFTNEFVTQPQPLSWL